MNIRDLFPLKGEVTQEILNTANVWDIERCRGALTLREALDKAGAKYKNVSWGTYWGSIYSDALPINLYTDMSMMHIIKPTTVEFKLK